eukprot:COSAG01_NODE_43487_length_429_cov_0.942424_1_plen_41_part_10
MYPSNACAKPLPWEIVVTSSKANDTVFHFALGPGVSDSEAN